MVYHIIWRIGKCSDTFGDANSTWHHIQRKIHPLRSAIVIIRGFIFIVITIYVEHIIIIELEIAIIKIYFFEITHQA